MQHLLKILCALGYTLTLAVATVATAQTTAVPTSLRIPEPKVRGLIRPVELAAFPNTYHSEFVAGPNSGLDSAYLIFLRVPPGTKGPPLHTHPADQFYYILQGELQLQLGTEIFTLEPQTLVRVPAGTPHHSWNSSSAEEMHIEVIVTPPPVEQLITAAEPRTIANASSLIRRVKRDAFESTGIKGSAVQWLARRDSGSPHAAINLEQSEPNAGGPGLHIHSFDQIYFVTEGVMHVQLGLQQFAAKPNTFVIIPAGTVHRQWNAGSATEKHLTLLLPEPKPGEPMAVSVALGKDLATAPK